ncbi:lysosomal alpha-mannosidase-like [Littorina saxatilis]|uniref:Alpha-mannosidase n=1 Tax=Littorina saxatilis TaxID=31220 RepID=A0AAN9GLZ4_9CAEN
MASTGKLFLVLCVLTVSGKDLRPVKLHHGDDSTCGYDSCNPVKDDMINVHVVPHTHDDVGWLITVDQYYYERVQYILDSVIPELEKDPSKRFIYVEIAFFARWYREQDDATMHTVQRLVDEGRLEFILGGWSMNDEGATHYNAIIDQHALGFEFLRETFGKCGKPRVGWQLDPFGHSREQASIFARFGFDSLFIGRLDYEDKTFRQNQTTMEMIWRGSPNSLGTQADLFTGVLPNLYQPPGQFCFDITCPDAPFVDDPRLHDVNVKDKVDTFLSEMADQAKQYTSNHLIVTMGSDFQYQAAQHWYINLDKLIKHVNARQANGSKVNVLYSTPSCYTYHVNKAGKTYTTKEDDFFPYPIRPHSFMTGYFTSRAALKGYIRRTNNFFQVIKQLDALAMLEDTDNSTFNINILAEAMGVAQHHDAVSGTEKQVVAYDYAERLANGIMEGQKVYNDAVKKLSARNGDTVLEHNFCTLLNISVCPLSEDQNQFMVTVYNPIARTGLEHVRLPVSTDQTASFKVTGPDGQEVTSELIPISPDTFRIPERKKDTAKYELVFPASLVPLGYSVYTVTRNAVLQKAALEKKTFVQGVDVVLQNEFISVSFDGTTGALKSMTNLEKRISIDVTQSFNYYNSFAGNNSQPEFQSSGAYIFRPNGSSVPVSMGNGQAKLTTKTYFVQSEMVQEVYQEFSPWVTQSVKLYNHHRFVQFHWTVGPIPITDNHGKEIVNRFQTSLRNNQVFYTDANGREMLKRQLNYRQTWPLNNTEPISGNYYPVNSRIYIRDEAKQVQFTVLTDRSEGGTSLREGEVELMVHRRILHDDNFGVGEPLNETGSDGKGLIVRGSHYVMLDPISSAAAGHRDLGERLFMAPSLTFSQPSSIKSRVDAKNTWSGVRQALPDNVHLLTLQQYPSAGPAPSETQPFLLRLEHFYEKGEDPVLSQPATVNLQDLFIPFDIIAATELTLGGDMVLSELNKLQWNYPHEDDHYQNSNQKKDSVLEFKSEKAGKNTVDDPLTLTLNPMEIRTFQITVKAAVERN